MAAIHPREVKYIIYIRCLDRGGEGGIRTPGTLARTPHFECGAIDHSATSPGPTARRSGLAASVARAISMARRRRQDGIASGGEEDPRMWSSFRPRPPPTRHA